MALVKIASSSSLLSAGAATLTKGAELFIVGIMFCRLVTVVGI